MDENIHTKTNMLSIQEHMKNMPMKNMPKYKHKRSQTTNTTKLATQINTIYKKRNIKNYKNNHIVKINPNTNTNLKPKDKDLFSREKRT